MSRTRSLSSRSQLDVPLSLSELSRPSSNDDLTRDLGPLEVQLFFYCVQCVFNVVSNEMVN